MDTKDAPQIIEHISKSIDYTAFDVCWIPNTAKFFVLGENPRRTGRMEICELDKGKLKQNKVAETSAGFKCCRMCWDASGALSLATGQCDGTISIWSLEQQSQPIWSAKGHKSIINAVDSIGDNGSATGPPQLVTGSRDGSVKVWDLRQAGEVLTLEPAVESETADCWTVAFGDAHSHSDRCIAAGYDNGDVKLFDMRKSTLRWEENVANGICHVSFDRKDIPLNKMAISTLESFICIYDLRTHHPEEGFAGNRHKLATGTVWGCHFLPQNRELFAACGGAGQLYLHQYSYPDQRSLIDPSTGLRRGVAGSITALNDKSLSSQPIVGFDWHPQKTGLCAMACLDQTVKVVIVTKLHLY